MTADSSLADRLGSRTLELVDIPSVSRDEARIAAHVAALVPASAFEAVWERDDCLYYVTPRRRNCPLVVLAGHLDTVPAQDNVPGRIEGEAVIGLGASDMKGGLAVMLELARSLAGDRSSGAPPPALDVGLLFFAREELPASESPLPDLFDVLPDLGGTELVVMLEPTDNTIQAGCLGNLNARLTFAGESAHSARPWLGVNAIERALEGLAPLVRLEPVDVEVSGLVFREVLTVTGFHAGIADNVVPDRATAHLNFRYAPTRTPGDAERRLAELVPDGAVLELAGNSPPARVAVHSPLVRRLREAGNFELEPKQAWTPVAEFSSRGLDAVNLGPGATRYAHRRDERVEIRELVRTFDALRRFVGGSV